METSGHKTKGKREKRKQRSLTVPLSASGASDPTPGFRGSCSRCPRMVSERQDACLALNDRE